jgi:hypothetical protein
MASHAESYQACKSLRKIYCGFVSRQGPLSNGVTSIPAPISGRQALKRSHSGPCPLCHRIGKREETTPFRLPMFFSPTSVTALLNTVVGFRSSSRSFATSSVLWYPKLKSHSGTKKRWRSLPNGLFKRVSSRLSLSFVAFTANAER